MLVFLHINLNYSVNFVIYYKIIFDCALHCLTYTSLKDMALNAKYVPEMENKFCF